MYKDYMDYHFDKSKLIKNNNTQYFVLGFVILFLLILNIVQKNNNDNLYFQSIKDNQIFENQRNKLINANNSIMLNLENSNKKITNLDSINNSLITKINEQKVIINNLKLMYEKANNHSRNYNADSIRQYFSNY